MTTFRIAFCAALLLFRVSAAESSRPNILWITSEDHGPEMGCYGDKLAATPNVDALAAKGLLYTRAWSTAPVCAPARTALISGMYPSANGSEHMRSLVPMPRGTKMFPQLLREAGYYCSNRSKEDYNLEKPGKVWDESSNKGHWRNRREGQPFFAVFNSTKSHESQMRIRPHTPIHEPAKVRVPAYHPDTPEVRRDWAQYYDKVTEADADAGRVLAQLEADGLAGNTIVFYFGDHGSGMPRSKRWPYNSGLHVPLVVYIPEQFKHLRPPEYSAGGKSDRLVSFVDFGPTVLSLAGIQTPAWMHGQSFMGEFIAPKNEFIHGLRGRMDERRDLVRSVTDGRYVYIRNYMPHLIYGQHLDYMWQTPTTRVWEKLHEEGKLNAAQSAFWNRKPPEELYDLRNDRDEVKNLADSPAHQEIKKRLRKAQKEHAIKIRDVGFLPESTYFKSRKDRSIADEVAEGGVPIKGVIEMAELASMLKPEAVPQLQKALADNEPAIRYWAALGLTMRGEPAVAEALAELHKALADDSAEVRIAAANAIAHFGPEDLRTETLLVLLQHADWSKNDVFTAMAALNSLDSLGQKAAPVAAAVVKLPTKGSSPDGRYDSYVPRLVEELQARFGKTVEP